MRLVLDDPRREPASEEMPAALVPPVEAPGRRSVQLSHSRRQLSAGGIEERVIASPDLACDKALQLVLERRVPEAVSATRAIELVDVDVAVTDSSGRDVEEPGFVKHIPGDAGQ